MSVEMLHDEECALPIAHPELPFLVRARFVVDDILNRYDLLPPAVVEEDALL